MFYKFLFGVFLILFFIPHLVFAESDTKILGEVHSPKPFSKEKLFNILDSLGGGGNPLEWDPKGVKDFSIMNILDKKINSNHPPQRVWVFEQPKKPILAVLYTQGEGETLYFYELNELDAKVETLKLNPKPNIREIFSDYQEDFPNHFVHLDEPKLQVEITDKRIHFTYQKLDDTPLVFDKNFAFKNRIEKKIELQNYRDFFKFEYVLMLRAFIQSTRGLFNWQPWHWYMETWIKDYFIPTREIEFLLTKGFAPEYITLFKCRMETGETIEFKITGNGFYEMNIIAP